MNISFSVQWTDSIHFIKTKIVEGLTPMQKKVALVAIAFFSLATLGYFIFRCTRRTSGATEDRQFRAADLRNKKVEDQDPATKATEEFKPQEISAAQIAIQNADQLRSILDSYKNETIDPNGQHRTLLLDAKGHLQGIDTRKQGMFLPPPLGMEINPIWLVNDKKKVVFYKVSIIMHKSQWEPSKNPAFELDKVRNYNYLADEIVSIVDATLQELNQLAKGAFQKAQKDFPNDPPHSDRWLTIFSDTDDYSSAALLGEPNDALSKEIPSDACGTNGDIDDDLGLYDAQLNEDDSLKVLSKEPDALIFEMEDEELYSSDQADAMKKDNIDDDMLVSANYKLSPTRLSI